MPPRRRWDGRPVRCRDARIGPLPSSKGGPRHWQARGPGLRFSRLPASARWIGQAPGRGLPAWAAPSRTSQRGCAVRSGLKGQSGSIAMQRILSCKDPDIRCEVCEDGTARRVAFGSLNLCLSSSQGASSLELRAGIRPREAIRLSHPPDFPRECLRPSDFCQFRVRCPLRRTRSHPPP